MTENIALGKNCAQSSTYPGDYACSNAVDDDTGTRQFTQNGSGEWWKVDLGDSYNIQSIVMYVGAGFGTFPYQFYIQTADDWAFTTNVQNIVNETNNQDAEKVYDTDDFGSVTTQYLRVITHTTNQYIGMAEFRVYGSSGTNENVEDVSLDLEIYGCRKDDLCTYLRAHDGIEVYDFKTELGAWGLVKEDFPSSLEAMYELLSDLGTSLETMGTQYKDLAADFDIKGQSIESLMSRFETAKAKYKNLAVFLSATDGSIIKDLAAFLSATDGWATRDAGLSLKAIRNVPAFRSVTAQRVSSVIHEVSS